MREGGGREKDGVVLLTVLPPTMHAGCLSWTLFLSVSSQCRRQVAVMCEGTQQFICDTTLVCNFISAKYSAIRWAWLNASVEAKFCSNAGITAVLLNGFVSFAYHLISPHNLVETNPSFLLGINFLCNRDYFLSLSLSLSFLLSVCLTKPSPY